MSRDRNVEALNREGHYTLTLTAEEIRTVSTLMVTAAAALKAVGVWSEWDQTVVDKVAAVWKGEPDMKPQADIDTTVTLKLGHLEVSTILEALKSAADQSEDGDRFEQVHTVMCDRVSRRL